MRVTAVVWLAVIWLVMALAASGAAQPAPQSPASPSPAPASPSPAAAPQPGSPAVVDGRGRLRADRVRYLAREQVFVASGNVVLTLGDLEIRSDSLRLEQVPQVATAEGRVIARQREMQLTAPTLRYEFRTEIADATGGVVLVQKGTTIRAEQMRFILREEVAIARGAVEVIQGNGTVTAPSLRHDARTGDVVADGGVTLVQPGSKLTGRRLLANLVTKRADVREDVTLIRAPGPPPGRADRVASALGGEETTVTAARIVFRWDVNEAEALENVVVRQKDKTAWADRMTYSEPANQLVLTDRVTLEQLSGEWLVREGLVSPPRDASERQGLASVTRVTCSRLVMTLRERNMVADGPVRVTQKDRWATGDRGTYTEATRRLVMTGNVRMQEEDGRRLQADRVVISLVEETFEAEGNVQTQFIIRSSPTPRP